MDLRITQDAQLFTIHLSGRFTFTDNPIFRTALQQFEKSSAVRAQIDCEKLDYIDSSGLGMLLVMRDIANSKEVQIELLQAKGQPKKVFDISRFDTLFTMTHQA